MEKTLKSISEKLDKLDDIKLIVFVYRDIEFGNNIDAIGIKWEEAPNIFLFHSQNIKIENNQIIFNLSRSSMLNNLLRKYIWSSGKETSPELSLIKNERRGYSLIIKKSNGIKYKLHLKR